MTEEAVSVGVYGDGRTFQLPKGWGPVEPDMLATALAQTHRAFLDQGGENNEVLARLDAYYDPDRSYAGATFLNVAPNNDFSVTAADLWAVSTLSMSVPPNAGRRLVGPSSLASLVEHKLRRIPTYAALTDVTAELLDDMWDMYDAIRTMLPPLGESEHTNQWVLASKLCAHKRPGVFPVRDSKVRGYLAANPRLGGSSGQLGWFSRDLQVFAYLITHPEVRRLIEHTRDELMTRHAGWPVDWNDLRLLDAALWTKATFSRRGSDQ